MLFNSVSFLLFFPLTTLIYYLLPRRLRGAWLLLVSCAFYAAFIPVYLWILLGVILIDYIAGLMIQWAGGRARGVFLIASLLANIGVLAVFKYFDFANDNLRALATFVHWNYPVRDLGMVLPIGLSFHTFQSMAYTIEVYRGNQKAERNLGIYALYVMFYPQLVAGPIERPQHMLHQFRERHPFVADQVFDGLKQMLWGFFKKLVIADRMAAIVDAVYDHPHDVGGAMLVLATWFFAIQIYCDFSGYSDIAIGAARVLGYQLMTNFDRPYAARSVGEFWHRWHISLSTWFRDYLYIPLGGSRVSLPRWVFNVMVVFVISGWWHGASWTFAIWGALHGIYLICSRLTRGLRARIAAFTGISRHPLAHDIWRVFATFNLVALAWVFFRADSVRDAWLVLSRMIGPGFFRKNTLANGLMNLPLFTINDIWLGAGLTVFLQAVEWYESASRKRPIVKPQPRWVRWPAYYALVLMILWLGALGFGRTFIYFQF
ncbi:MAG TPA: MBOAT family O-acyltransferase [Tepidisphaeraceae bacterium]|nr:MBOAT family O-acyltransferase [Tepidisphaeraceae bacterium]